MAWQDTLRLTLQKVDAPLKQQNVKWMLVGSAALALWGVKVQPNNVDIRTQMPDGVEAFRELLITYSLPEGSVPISSALTEPLPDWRSNLDQQIAIWTEPNGGRYWLGRWPLAGGILNVRCTIYPQWRAKLVEYYGDPVWGLVRQVQFEDWQLPICPLEVQLAYVAKQGQTDRVRAISDYLKTHPYDKQLLERALHDRPPKEALGQLLNQTLGIPIVY
jgi:hypothetical protein